MSEIVKTKSTSQSFLKGALVLTISMIAVKLCGLAQKVLLTNLYGTLGETYAEFGTGLFANAYELYVPLFTLATVGFPIAVSRLVSENYAKERYNDVRQVHRVAKPFFLIMGIVCFLIMTVGSFFYVSSIGINQPYALPALLMLAPTILFGCLVSVYRGYYEGMRNMTPTAISEVIEAFSKIAIGVVLSYIVVNIGSNQYANSETIFGMTFASKEEAFNTLVSISVAASIFGITMGSFIAFLFLRIRFALRKGEIPAEYYINSVEALSKKETFKKMAATALPIGIGALVMSLSGTIDSFIIQRVILGMAENQPVALMAEFNGKLNSALAEGSIHTCVWGYYTASLTLVSIVIAVTQVFGTSAMPNVTAAYTKGNKEELKQSMNTVLRLTTMVTFPCAIGLSVLSEPILSLVYSGNENISIFGAEVLQVLGLAVIFMGTITPICSMLQGIGKVKSSMGVYIFGTVSKILVSYLFARNISINIVGSAIGSLVSNFLMCAVALFILVRNTKIMPDFVSVALKPMLSAVLCGASAYVCSYILHLNLLISIVISAIIYLVMLLILHTFTKNEVLMLPKGKKIVIILEKLHLIR
ncbi:MAG: polysaccharide biosynthesis protein [Ruminococcaceae bacterium]|nr:polysaccharide biosynthesis protein [Oscillospiraceae bacterium]